MVGHCGRLISHIFKSIQRGRKMYIAICFAPISKMKMSRESLEEGFQPKTARVIDAFHQLICKTRFSDLFCNCIGLVFV